jgi:hypothetical protein
VDSPTLVSFVLNGSEAFLHYADISFVVQQWIGEKRKMPPKGAEFIAQACACASGEQ